MAGCGQVPATGQDGSVAIDAPLIDAMEIDAPAAISAACVETPSCEEAAVLVRKEDLIAVTTLCPTWGEAEVDRFLPRTPTLRVTSDFTVCASDFTLPSACLELPGCNPGVYIEIDPKLTGVSHTQSPCGGALLNAGVRFRVRYYLEGPNFGNPQKTARLRFERACDAACETGEHRCDANHACYADRDACFDCGIATREECACRTVDNAPVAECSVCVVRRSDTIFQGWCNNSACTMNPEPACPETP